MLGKRSSQRGMFEADHLYLDFVGRDSFYGFLATERGNHFRDEDLGRLYCPDSGRNTVPPSLLATALLLPWPGPSASPRPGVGRRSPGPGGL